MKCQKPEIGGGRRLRKQVERQKFLIEGIAGYKIAVSDNEFIDG